jgi:hypothetical protein
MWSRLLALACALLLLPAQALAGVKEKVAALAPSGLVLPHRSGRCNASVPKPSRLA